MIIIDGGGSKPVPPSSPPPPPPPPKGPSIIGPYNAEIPPNTPLPGPPSLPSYSEPYVADQPSYVPPPSSGGGGNGSGGQGGHGGESEPIVDQMPPEGGEVPYAPEPTGTCPEGESLYKVWTSQGGTQYVYGTSADDAARKLGKEAGYSATVTRVMSPAAYGGAYARGGQEVATVDGRRVVVPIPGAEGISPQKALGDYKIGEGYNLVDAYADKVIGVAGMRSMGFSEAAISEAVNKGGILRNIKESDYYDPSTGSTSLGLILAEGIITEPQARLIYDKAAVDQAVALAPILFAIKGTQSYDTSTGSIWLGPAIAAGLISEAQARKAQDSGVFSKEDVDSAVVYAASVGSAWSETPAPVPAPDFSWLLAQTKSAEQAAFATPPPGTLPFTVGTRSTFPYPVFPSGLVRSPDVGTALKYVEQGSYQPIGKIPLRPGEKPLPDEFVRLLREGGTMGYVLPPGEPSGSFVSTLSTKWGLPSVISSRQVGLLEQTLGRSPTRTEFVGVFGEAPNLPLPYMDVPTSKLYSQLYPQYSGSKYAAIEAGTAMFPAMRAAYPQVGLKEITPSEWAMTGVQVALLGYGAYTGLSPLVRAGGGIRSLAGQVVTSQRGGGFTVGPQGIGFSRFPPLIQTPGLIYEPVGTTLKSVGPAQRFYTGIVREGPVTPTQLGGYRPITGTKVFGEMGYRPTTLYGPLSELPRISPSVMVSGGLKVPTTGFAGPGVFGPKIPIYPLEPIRWGGGIGIRIPLKPLVGLPYTPTAPKTTYETLGVTYPSSISIPFKVTTPIQITRPSPFISPIVGPFISPLPSPIIAPFPSPITPLIPPPMPGPVVQPIPLPVTNILPTPITIPTIIPTTVTPIVIPEPILPKVITPIPTTPEPGFKFPWFLPQFGGGIGGGGGHSGKGMGGLLGIGKWSFSGFKVSGPHPLVPEMVSYDWMGGKVSPYGVGKKGLKTRPTRSTKGLVRLAV